MRSSDELRQVVHNHSRTEPGPPSRMKAAGGEDHAEDLWERLNLGSRSARRAAMRRVESARPRLHDAQLGVCRAWEELRAAPDSQAAQRHLFQACKDRAAASEDASAAGLSDSEIADIRRSANQEYVGRRGA